MKIETLAVIIPAYNEQDRIEPSLARIAEYYATQPYAWSVMVVSDGSSDRTNEIVEAFAAKNPRFALNAYHPNRGKGFAVRKGMLEADGDAILFMDADLATPVEETAKLLATLEQGVDIAIGSRPIKGSNLEVHQPWWRESLGRFSNKLVQMLAVRGIKDTQCGFKLFRRDAARDVFSRCKLNGFSFDFEALMIARDLGYRIEEIPIRWAHQEGSKVVFWRDYPRALRDLVKLRLAGRKSRLRPNES